jgi:hypothetical protein
VTPFPTSIFRERESWAGINSGASNAANKAHISRGCCMIELGKQTYSERKRAGAL